MNTSPAPDDEPASRIYVDFTAELLAHFPLTRLSTALHSQLELIIATWTAMVSDAIPPARRLPFTEVKDGVPDILSAMADAFGSIDSTTRRGFLSRSPQQGITRFQQHYEPRDIMAEDRLLRRVVAVAIEQALGEPMTSVEQGALNMALDLMGQQAMAAFVEHQGLQLRSAAEAELRYLSFLSHDLHNNLSNTTIWLQVLRTQLQSFPEMAEQVGTLDTIQQAILSTIGGMGRLLQADRLRHTVRQNEARPVDLRSLVTNQTRQFADQAKQRGLRIVVDVPAEARFDSDPDLLTLIIQNLIGNAAKFAVPGSIVVRAAQVAEGPTAGQWIVTVADEGPGIPPEYVKRIFQAFQRGTMEGESGVGLGLAIAARAAALLGGTLTVESAVGAGSTFRLLIPAANPGHATPRANT